MDMSLSELRELLMDKEAWRAEVERFYEDLQDLLELTPQKDVLFPPSILAWKTPWTEEPGGLQSMESQRVGHD